MLISRHRKPIEITWWPACRAASSLVLIKARLSRMPLLPRFADEPRMPHAATLSADISLMPCPAAPGVNDTQR